MPERAHPEKASIPGGCRNPPDCVPAREPGHTASWRAFPPRGGTAGGSAAGSHANSPDRATGSQSQTWRSFISPTVGNGSGIAGMASRIIAAHLRICWTSEDCASSFA